MTIKHRLSEIYDTFSRRRRPQYSVGRLTETTRTRILLLLRDVFAGTWKTPHGSHGDYTREFWVQIHNLLQHLYGRPRLSEDVQAREPWEDGLSFALNCETDRFFDFLEGIFKVECTSRALWERNQLVDAINEILRVDGTAFQLTPVVTQETPIGRYGGVEITTLALPKVICVDDQVAHTEAVVPALGILGVGTYAAADAEFRMALDDYRKGDFSDCLVKCGSAFESVLKILCTQNRIPFDAHKDTAGPLLDKLFSKSSLDCQTFKEPLLAIGRMRNRLSVAHGGGQVVKVVDRHVAQFAVTATAAAIVLLVRDTGKLAVPR